MLRKFRIDILSIVIVVVLPGFLIWFKGNEWGWHSVEKRAGWIVLLCIVFVVLFVWSSFDSSSRPAVAARRIRHWVAKQTGSSAQRNTETPDGSSRAAALRSSLRDRHGRRWRYRERWVLIAGDEPLVKRLAPGLVDTGFAITGDTVLLYAKQTSSTLDTNWLDQIRRLRRRRPVDAVVAVTRNRSSSHAPFDTDNLSQRLARHARALRWAAPAYLLDATDFGEHLSSPGEAIGFTWSNARIGADEIDTSLHDLTVSLADAGVVRLTNDAHDSYPAELSKHISNLHRALSGLVLQTARSRVWRHAVHGLLFTPLLKERELTPPTSENDDGPSVGPPHRTIWQTVAGHSRTIQGRRVGLSLSTTAAWIATGLVGCWIGGTMLSGFVNRATVENAADAATQLMTAQDGSHALQALNELDRQIDTLEIRRREGPPWRARFGLNRDRALPDVMWPTYANAAAAILVAPIRQKLEADLRRLASLSDAEIASGGDASVQAAYDTLKAYLMLARPDHAVAAFVTPQLLAIAEPARPANSRLSPGAWEDLRQQAITFFAGHLGRAPLRAMEPDPALVASARQTIIGVRGIQNSTDAIYQQILDDAQAKYPPVSLAKLLGDTTSRGLFNTTATVPGVFTRAAWDERIAKAIDEASGRHTVAGDWVLSDTKAASPVPSTLKTELRQRYFDDYARAWALFLNSLRWQRAPALSATADQLTLLGDAQRSPLVALMNALVYQAGAGANAHSLADNLVSKAQQLVGGGEQDPSKRVRSPVAPLAGPFGPILRLTGSDPALGISAQGEAAARLAATGDLSLARYLERVTAMRLKTSQIVAGADPDAMARLAAQSVLQGRTSEIADSRDYASRVAASLGERWSGFGDLFRAPFDQAWQVVAQPAASSLNEIWRTAIVADWNRTFAGRYPFADSDNDASLPEMARFMRLDNGVIAQFVTTQLAGVVERQGSRWVAAQGANHGALTIDPAFLASLNQLARIATVLFPSGDAHIRYELQAVPTPGVTDTRFVLSGRELHYFNQKQAWTPFEWPGQSLENLSRIEWQTERGGLRTALDAQGRFGLIRLLERATVSPQDSARYLLSWAPDTRQGLALRVQLRSEAGAGPLDVLQLRHFALPDRVFVTRTAGARQTMSAANPPPLPAEAIAAAHHAAVPLPPGLPGRMPLPDDATPAHPVAATALAEAGARPVAPGGIAQPSARQAKALPPVTMTASSDAASRPFGYALGLSRDAFSFQDTP